jgi:hypothetical protein
LNSVSVSFGRLRHAAQPRAALTVLTIRPTLVAPLVGCSVLLARLAASTARASRWYGLDHGAEKTIHGLRRVEDLCNIGLEDNGHGVFAHSRGKAIGAALAEIELVLRSQFVTSAF